MLTSLKLAWKNTLKSLRDFTIYFVTILAAVSILYSFNSLESQAAILNLSKNSLEIVKRVAEVVHDITVFLVIILGFLVAYANQFLMRRRKREFATYLLLGMKASQVARIVTFETLIAGVVALFAGLGLGVLVSQIMTIAVAQAFNVTSTQFIFVFAPDAAIFTTVAFCSVFAVSIIFNILTISKQKLISLISAHKRSEKAFLKHPWVHALLFAISLVIIGYSYYLLDKSKFIEQALFIQATVLVVIGTALFFFSASGFIQKTAQLVPSVYYHKLTLFSMRQFASRINTSWISLTVVCTIMFLAICGVSTGSALVSGLNTQTEIIQSGPDLSVNMFFDREGTIPTTPDLVRELKERFPDLASHTGEATQCITYDFGDMRYSVADIAKFIPEDLKAKMVAPDESILSSSSLHVVKLSDFNAMRQMHGFDPITLADDEVACDMPVPLFQNIWHALCNQGHAVELFGKSVYPKEIKDIDKLRQGYASTNALIIPDSAFPDGAQVRTADAYFRYTGDPEVAEKVVRESFIDALKHEGAITKHFGGSPAAPSFISCETKITRIAEGRSVGFLASFTVLYVGSVLLLAAMSVLAVQQISESVDNIDAYRILWKFGVSHRSMSAAILAQVLVYFLFPLAVAAPHVFVAMSGMNRVIEGTSAFRVGEQALATTGFVVLIFGVYFLVTFLYAKVVILRSACQNR